MDKDNKVKVEEVAPLSQKLEKKDKKKDETPLVIEEVEIPGGGSSSYKKIAEGTCNKGGDIEIVEK